MNRTIYLASRSPRRVELLKQIGIEKTLSKNNDFEISFYTRISGKKILKIGVNINQ